MDVREVERETEGNLTHFVDTDFIADLIDLPCDSPHLASLHDALKQTYEIVEAIGTLTCIGTTLYKANHTFSIRAHHLMPTVAFVYVNTNDKDVVAKLIDERCKMQKMRSNCPFLGRLRMGTVVDPWLAYGASLHILHSDQLRDSANPSYLPATSVSTWAAAPPPPAARSHQHKHDKRADDIWLVGILLLEMAYGGLRVKDRGELDSFLHEMRNHNKLPKKLNDDCNSDSKPKRASSPYLPACFNPKKAVIAPVGLEYMPEERVFSRKFVNLVLRCLNPDPTKRPTAHKLVQSKIFNNIREVELRLR